MWISLGSSMRVRVRRTELIAKYLDPVLSINPNKGTSSIAAVILNNDLCREIPDLLEREIVRHS